MSDYPDRIRVGTDVYGGLYVDPTNHAANCEYVRVDLYEELEAKLERLITLRESNRLYRDILTCPDCGNMVWECAGAVVGCGKEKSDGVS